MSKRPLSSWLFGDAPAEKASKNLSGAERYKLGKTLGAGAFASVRQATDASTGRDVAVKLMSKTKTSETAAKKERELLAALCKKEPHPNIVNLLDAFDTPTSWALVLELVTGGEVFDRVCNQGAFSETDAASVMRQIALALKHLHSLDIVHRDLKPENLLLTASDDVKVADFGLATFYGKAHPPLRQTCGTINYVAPEMLLASASRPYGEAIDLWSVGAILFTLLGAYCAFDPMSNLPHTKVEQRIKRNEWDFDAFPQQWQHVSEEAKRVIRALLEPDVKLRLTADQLLMDPWTNGLKSPKHSLPKSHRDALQAFQDGRRLWRSAIDAAALFLGSPLMAQDAVTSKQGATATASAAANSDSSTAVPAAAEEELRRAFGVFDRDGSGSIDLDELREVMHNLHMGGTYGADAVEVMSQIDTDGDGTVSVDEFKAMVRPLYDTSGEALRKIFNLFDADKSGYIEKKELLVMLQRLGLGKDACTKDALQKVFAAADLNDDDRVDFAEFTGLFARAAGA